MRQSVVRYLVRFIWQPPDGRTAGRMTEFPIVEFSALVSNWLELETWSFKFSTCRYEVFETHGKSPPLLSVPSTSIRLEVE